MSLTKSHLTNALLFELSLAAKFGLQEDLVAYLLKTEFPWLALGKNLTDFISDLIAKVPHSQRHQGNVSPQAYLENADSIVIGAGAVIEPGAYIAGPTYLAPGAIVRHGAYVRGSVYVGTGAVVGHTTEAKGSILLPGAKAAHFAYVGDSILGVDTNLGAGTKLANLRFDHGPVGIRVGSEMLDTGLKKCGALLGNRAQTGCNCVTNPGTIFMPDAMALPNATARGVLRSRT